MNRSLTFVVVIVPVLPLVAHGQAEGIPFHVDDPTSTTANPPLRKFLPSKNRYAQRLLTDKFVFVNDLQKVDHDVLRIFYSKVPARDIANRGQRFNPTDIEVGPHLPSRRFVLSGVNPSMCFILYEVGGIGYHHNLMVFSKDKKWSLVAAVAVFLKDNSFESLKTAVRAGKFFDQPGYPQY
jgi:hypothetical protein